MQGMKTLAVAAVAAVALAIPAAPHAQAQVSISIGAPPACPYGYYDYAPYSCAPAGYYGPEWFNGGVFIGAGRWFHGPANFHGTVDNHFDPQHGYKGPAPKVGEHPQGHAPEFHGNEQRDGRGHVAKR